MGCFLYAYEKETLFRIQEFNLFLNDATFYRNLADYPGGTLQWMACFLTQFFYYPAIGTSILVLLWCAIYAVTRSAFRLSGCWNVLPVIIPAALLAGMVEMGYFMYYIKFQGYYFTPPLGILFAMVAVWIFSRLNRFPYTNYAWLALWTAIGYPLFGAYALAGTFYMTMLCWRIEGTLYRSRIIPTIWGLLLIIGVPLIAWHCYAQTAISEIYMAALPCFDVSGECYEEYRIPYYILFATPFCCALLYNFTPNRQKAWVNVAMPLLVLTGLVLWLKNTWYVDDNFRKELLMQRAIENEDWESIPKIFLSAKGEPTRLMVMNKNLALFRLGRAGNEMFKYREGGAKANAPFLVRLTQVGGKALYFHYGQENYCYRWCMEDGVTYGWKTEYLKYMTKTSIANGDHKVARKYINLLKLTLFHKDWAERYEKYLDEPETILNSSELQPVIRLMPTENQLNSDMNVIEMYLLRNFAYGDSDDPLYQELTLIAALQMKDIGIFWPRFFKYATLNEGKPMPLHYQEAAYLYGHLENKVDISRMPFDEEVKESYRDFMAFTQRCGGMSTEQMAEVFRPRFGKTFYYFYFLVNGLHTY